MAYRSFAFTTLMVSLTAGAAWISPVRAQPDAKANVPSHAAPLVDGVYQGTTERLTGAKVDGCSPGGPISLQVSDARFALPWRPLQTFDARIDAHGAFTATTANRVAAADKHMTIVPALQGHVVEGRISGEYGTRWCSYRFEAVRQ